MMLTGVEVGFFEDYEDEEALEVGFAGVDEAGVNRTLSIQRCTYGPDEQDIESGMDSYNISTERGATAYGCLRRVAMTESLLTFVFLDEDADVLEISNPVEVDLTGVDADAVNLSAKLREILDWGSVEKRPELIGLPTADGM